MSYLYSFIGGDGLGITLTTSIFKGDKDRARNNDGDSSDFYGVLGIDISPGGPLQNYFP